MKNFKRLLAIILAGLMLLSLVACGGKKDENVTKYGVIELPGMGDMMTNEHNQHLDKIDNSDAFVIYDNLSAALMDLESGKITAISVEEGTANYIASHNNNVAVTKIDGMTNFSMMTLESNTEVYDTLNNAIKEMKADGTLDNLIENELKAYIESDPEVKDLPAFEGAKTIKIGVTGDVPPMDFVAANGKAAGFNIALLAEIANRAQVNIEIVQIESGSRPMALSSSKVDAVFWTKSTICTVCGAEGAEKIDGTLVTESYFSDSFAVVTLTPTK